jgi:hypothetical protein
MHLGQSPTNRQQVESLLRRISPFYNILGLSKSNENLFRNELAIPLRKQELPPNP